jgi:L-iditol 2-dehydrogenase
MRTPALPEKTMLGVVKFAPGFEGIELRELPIPEPGPGEVVLEVLAAGICGTDVHIAKDEYAHQTPVVMGHEVLGIVSSVGSEQDKSWLGKKVAVETYYSACEVCSFCRAGRRNLCPDRRSIGSYKDGGFAEYMKVPVVNLHVIPETLGHLDGVLAEPLACVTNCLLNPPRIQPGHRVLVTGPGAMGQLAAQVAMVAGGHVTLAGLKSDQERLEIARAIGIHITTEEPEPEAFDVVIECSGNAFAAAAALRAAKRGGSYIQVGIFGHDVSVPMDLVLLKELTISSGFASTPKSWLSAMELLHEGKLTLGPLVTKTVEINNFAEAFASAMRGEGVKTVVVPGSGLSGA